MKYRYFLRDPEKRYRGLFRISPEHVEKLRAKGWEAIRAANRFGKIHPWCDTENGEEK